MDQQGATQRDLALYIGYNVAAPVASLPAVWATAGAPWPSSASASPPLSVLQVTPAKAHPLFGWSAVTGHVALTYTAILTVALNAHDAGHLALICSPSRVLAHAWASIL